MIGDRGLYRMGIDEKLALRSVDVSAKSRPVDGINVTAGFFGFWTSQCL